MYIDNIPLNSWKILKQGIVRKKKKQQNVIPLEKWKHTIQYCKNRYIICFKYTNAVSFNLHSTAGLANKNIIQSQL